MSTLLAPRALAYGLLVGLISFSFIPRSQARPSTIVAFFKKAVLEGQLNINTASQVQLEMLPGIGPAMANRIIEYRTRRPFQKLIQLMRIKGIGRKTFAALAPHLVLEGETTLREVPDASP